MPVELTVNARDFTSSEALYTYEKAARSYVSALTPSFGSSQGGASVTLVGAGFVPRADLRCRFGGESAPGMYVSSDMVSCYVPGSMGGAHFTSVTLDGASASAESLYAYREDPRVDMVTPKVGASSGGSVVHVSGRELAAETYCVIGLAGPTSATLVSTSLMACETPAHDEGVASVSMSADPVGMQLSSHVGSFEFMHLSGVDGVSTPSGTDEGGAEVRVYSLGLQSTEQLGCRFGTLGPVEATLVLEGEASCVSPAHIEGAVPVELTVNARDFTSSEAMFTFISLLRASVEDVSPSRSYVGADGYAVVHVGGMSSLNPLFSPLCKLGGIVAQSVGSGGGDIMLCSLSDITSQGFASVTINAFGKDPGRLRSKDIFTIEGALPMQQYLIRPSVALSDGGTIVFTEGDHLIGEEILCDEVGQFSSARQISSALISCESRNNPEGMGEVNLAIVSIGEEPVRNTASGLGLEFVRPMDSTGIHPSAGSGMGGATVSVYATVDTEALSDLSCHIGTIGPLIGRHIASGHIECVTPAHAVDMRVPAGASLSQISTQFAFGGTTPLASYMFASDPELRAIIPHASVIRMEAVSFEVHGARLSSDMACLIGSHVTAAFAMSASAAVCTAPVDGRAGFSEVSLQVTMPDSPSVPISTKRVGSDPITLEFFEPSIARVIMPTIVDANSPEPILLFGEHLLGDVCVFSAEASRGDLLSSTVLRCPAPAGMQTWEFVNVGWKDESVHVARVGAGGDGVGVTLQRAPPMRISGAQPLAGPEAGGSIVSVFGDNFLSDSMSSQIVLRASSLLQGATHSAMACRFGPIQPVHARVESPHLLKCLSPASYPGGDGLLSVSMDRGRSFVSSLPMLTFEPRQPATIRAVVPNVGVMTGGTPVFIVGYNFVNSSMLKCRFGATESEATFLSSASVLCVAPRAARAGPVFIELSTNGADYTADRMLFTYTVCPSGSYCPASSGEPIKSPRGSFCPGQGNTNFTLCPPGTIQPHEGSSGCLPSPAGHYAPDFGLVTATVCPPGWICDETGLRILIKPCVAGHYCLEGTWTANFTDFEVPERPLPCPFGYYCGPGATTDKSIIGNYTTPQPCYAGYVCEPGSQTPQGSGPCPSGMYCPPGRMIACPPRAYCPGVANTEPRLCPPGSYNQEYGKSSCKLCPLGTICPGFAREYPVICPRGFLCDILGLAEASQRCPAGHYCLANTLTMNPLASLDEAQLLRSSPLALNVENFRPKPCLPATYCTSGVTGNVTIEGDFSAPQPCKEGSYCEWATSDRQTDVLQTQETEGGETGIDISNPMFKCPAGHYCPKGTYIPIPAPRGSFARGIGNAQPTPCLPGTYTHYEGFDSCLPCPAGYEAPFDGTFKPSICRAGTFRSLRDSITCRNCPMGSWSPATGVTEESLCIPCNPGTVCGVEGMQNNKPFGEDLKIPTNEFVTACEDAQSKLGENADPEADASCYMVETQPLGKATLCPEGYVCDARTTTATEKCPDGYYCGYGTTPESQFHNLCPAGYYCPEGASASSRFQFICQRCHYCPAGTGVILPRCVEGTESSPGATAIFDCRADGITFWQVQPLRSDQLMYVWARELGNLATGDSNSTGDGEGGTQPYDPSYDYSVLAGFPPSPPPPTPPGLPPDAVLAPPPPTPVEVLDASSVNGTNGTSTNGTSGIDTTSGPVDLAPCLGKNFHRLEPEIVFVERDLLSAVFQPKIPYNDTLGRVMTKYKLKHNNVAKLTFDFRNINPEIYYSLHYEIIVFTGNAVDRTACVKDTAERKRVPCPPYDTGDGINVKTMGIIEDRQYEEKCPPSTSAIELPYWLSFWSPPEGNPIKDPTKPYEGLDFVRKRTVVELNIMGLIETEFRVEIRLLHGLYQAQSRDGFQDTLCMEMTESVRAAGAPDSAFHVITPRNDDYQLPLNIPLTEIRFRQLSKEYIYCNEDNPFPACRNAEPNFAMSFNSSRSSEVKEYYAFLEANPDFFAKKDGTDEVLDLGVDLVLARRRMLGRSGANHNVSVSIGDPLAATRGRRRTLLQSEDAINQATAAAGELASQNDGTVVSNLVSDIIEIEKNVLEDPSQYWKGDRDLFAASYLPFFSACRGFDSYMHLYQILEIPYQKYELTSSTGEASTIGNYGGCDLVTPEETIFIFQWAPQQQMPNADGCNLEFQCLYEENILEAAALSRWFEAEQDTLFYITESPEPNKKMFQSSMLARDDTDPPMDTSAYAADIASQSIIPVTFTSAAGQYQKGTAPTSVSMDMSFWQKSFYDKQMVEIELTLDEFVNVKKHDGEYKLSISLEALNWFNLLNSFRYDFLFYILLFIGLGGLAVFINASFWLLNRICTRLREPPKFRFLPYLSVATTAPFYGTILAMIPFFTAQYGVRLLIANIGIDGFPDDLDNLGKTLSSKEVTRAMNGRMAVCFMVVSVFMMVASSKILVPKRATSDGMFIEEDEDTIFHPEAWKRSHYILINILVNGLNIALIEFSFTTFYSENFFTVFVAMKALHLVVENYVGEFLQEDLVSCPTSVGLAMTGGLVTIAAEDFTDFTLGTYMDFVISLGEYVFLDAALGAVFQYIGRANSFITRTYYRLRGNLVAADLAGGYVESEESVVEDLMSFLTGWGVNSVTLIMTPFMIYFYFDFNEQLQFAELFGIRTKDLIIYILFALVIMPFQMVMDIFIFNTQELFHGWKVYEYMKYASYRFNNRSARWKGFEAQTDQSISESLRSIDLLCFSSQFYFIVGIAGTGVFVFALSIAMMLRVEYNMFKDPMLSFCCLLTLGSCSMVQRAAMLIANYGGLWAIKGDGRNFSDGLLDDPDELPFETVKQDIQDEGRGGRWSSIDDLTVADLTSTAFRHRFLEYNRSWILEQLTEILTPRTAKRLSKLRKGGARVSISDDSDSDDDGPEMRFEGPVNLSPSSYGILRLWLSHARQSASGHFGRRVGGLSSSSDSDSDGGIAARMRRFGGPVRLSDDAQALLLGWLAAARQARGERGTTKRALSSSDDDSSSDGSERGRRMRNLGPVILAPRSRMMLVTWLSHARASGQRKAMHSKPAQQAVLSSESDDDSGSDDAAAAMTRSTKMVLHPQSLSLIRQWLDAAKKRRGTAQKSRDNLMLSDLDTETDMDDVGGRFRNAPIPRPDGAAAHVLREWIKNMRRKLAERALLDSSTDSGDGGGGGGRRLLSSTSDDD